MIQYILELVAFQLVFLMIYDFWLKRETFFQWNRVYLISTYVLAMILPWVKIEALKTTVPDTYYVFPEFLWNANDLAVSAVVETESEGISISSEYLVFFGGMFLASVFFAYKIRQLYLLKRNGKIERFSEFTQIIIADSKVAFSFFRFIFLGDKILERDYKSVIAHELVHIRQRHTYDLLFFELMRIVCWFNPLVYVYQSRIAELHEFIADAQVAKTNKVAQYQLLLSQVFETQHISFINQFFKTSLIKKRIVMLQKTQSKKIWQLKYLLLVPMVLGMLIYTSCKKDKDRIIENIVKVNDLASLTVAEEKLVFDKLNELSDNKKDWELFVKDENSALRYQNSKDGSYLYGPDGKKVLAKVGIDSRLRSGVVFKESNRVRGFKHNFLIGERRELLKTLKEDDPILVNLNRKIDTVKKEMNQWLNDVNAFNGFFPIDEIEKPPIFPGCNQTIDKLDCFKKKLASHIKTNLVYSKTGKNEELLGEVVLTIAISEFGHGQLINIIGGNSAIRTKIERVIELLPEMQPGSWEGDNWGVYYSFPIEINYNS